MKFRIILFAVPGMLAALLVSAPALADRADASTAIAEARAVMREAANDGADRYAAIELKAARDNLSKAQVDLDNRRWDAAEMAAVRALRDAELADARTRAARAEASLAELQAAVDTLKSELNRMGGES